MPQSAMSLSFDPSDIEVDDQGDWYCPECKSPHVMIHEKCQCDIPTASGTVYQVHDEDGLGLDITIGIIGCLYQDRLSFSDGETWAHKFY
jgi:hypothetical protein